MNKNFIKMKLLNFLIKGNPLLRKLKKILLNDSLLQRGYIDSYAFIELTSFIENFFKIKIEDKEINPENF